MLWQFVTLPRQQIESGRFHLFDFFMVLNLIVRLMCTERYREQLVQLPDWFHRRSLRIEFEFDIWLASDVPSLSTD